MSLCTGGDLMERVVRKRSYPASEAAVLVRSIVSAISYMHDLDVVHRDLKPENMVFETSAEDTKLLIMDFGISMILSKEEQEKHLMLLTTTCGTLGYMAAEIYRKTGHGKPVFVHVHRKIQDPMR
jgi:serine/threonine protein kinase